MLDIETEERYLRDPAVFKQEILALGDDIQDVISAALARGFAALFCGFAMRRCFLDKKTILPLQSFAQKDALMTYLGSSEVFLINLDPTIISLTSTH